MAADKNPAKKIPLEEALRRIRPVFIMMMIFPLVGLVAAMIVLYVLKVKNLLFMEGLLLLAMAIYVSTTYLVARKMGQIGRRTKPLEGENEP